MKINVYALFTVVTLFLLFASSISVETTNANEVLKHHHKPKPLKTEKFTLKNPIRLYNTRKEKVLTTKVRYVWHSSLNRDPKNPINLFDYKLFQINDEHMVIYRVNQALENYDENTVNSENYLMTIKLENIDLLCLDHYYLCTLGEFKREYKKKMKHVDFKTSKSVTDSMLESTAKENCIIFTIGLFHSLNDVGYLCFDDRQDTIFFLDLLSERILNRYKADYEGALRLVNQVIINIINILFY